MIAMPFKIFAKGDLISIEISEAEAKSIEKFLLTLSGKKPTITYPQLPASTQNTPKPEL